MPISGSPDEVSSDELTRKVDSLRQEIARLKAIEAALDVDEEVIINSLQAHVDSDDSQRYPCFCCCCCSFHGFTGMIA